ncbi:MAG: GNAT family N-acetyltransferase [bacterium]
MLEFERNSPIETAILAEFFARCGWKETEAGPKLDWALAGSEEWVICKLDGELIGFGRSCRLGPVKRVVFDVLVDSRFQGSGLRSEIVRLLSENAGSLEEVSVFTERQAHPHGFPPGSVSELSSGYLPEAPPGAYLGRKRIASTETPGGSE